MSEKTPTDLALAISEAVEQHPEWGNDQVAKAAFSKLNPGEEWPGKNPTTAYVKKVRRRLTRKKVTTKVEIEEMPKDMFEEPKPGAEEQGEPFDPLKALEGLDEEPQPGAPPAPGFDTSVDFTDEDLNDIIGLPFSKLARYTGYDGWRLNAEDPDDAKFIQLSNKMAHKYVPDLLAKYGLEILWSISLLGFVGERVAGHREYKAKHASLLKKAEQPVEPAPASVIPPAPTPSPEPQPLPPGQLAAGEDELKRRLGKH